MTGPVSPSDTALEPLVSGNALCKSFSGTEVLHSVTVAFCARQVHAICGENGAGKSTLLKIISGVHRPDSGSIVTQGRKHAGLTVHEARKHGIVAVLQDPTLIPTLSIAENFFLGSLPGRAIVRRREMTRSAQEALDRYGLPLDASELVAQLTLGKRRLLEIVRASEQHPRLVILDEPTASLSDSEVRMLAGVIGKLKQESAAIAYVSHRLREVLEFSDVITVLRDGTRVATEPAATLDENGLASLMIGSAVSRVTHRQESTRRRNDPRARGLTGRAIHLGASTAPFDLDLPVGEVIGFYGLVGSGRSSLARSLVGLGPLPGGEITLNGSAYRPTSPSHAARLGVMYCPEDRKGGGLFFRSSINENVSLITLRSYTNRADIISVRRERQAVIEVCRSVKLRPLNIDAKPSQLSGGNQQKVLLARYFAATPDVLILDEPTVGVDIGARRDIHEMIAAKGATGGAVVLISSDPEEVLDLCQHVYVFRDATVVAEFAGSRLTRDALTAAALVSPEGPPVP
ncbi:sugar ABC transporter ATP-binding protein [Conexibacter sp. S30A1]|uniref:sugar ABC transporter ATP-binding protein n=1 Tax=Conexibacter sp. S30A1 TaxID=2937800 RepID=UPI00200EE753|nr:sugar ABC transporter ATP-binding protein [Conexibacter sp. S30A1]